MNKLLSIQEVANILGVSTKTLRRWEEKGILVPLRTSGNQRRYMQGQVDNFRQKRGDLPKISSVQFSEAAPSQLLSQFSIQEVANILGVSTKTLRRWEEKGILVPLRTSGNQRRYMRDQIDNFKQQRIGLPQGSSQSPEITSLKLLSESSEDKEVESAQHWAEELVKSILVFKKLAVSGVFIMLFVAVSGVGIATLKSADLLNIASLPRVLSVLGINKNNSSEPQIAEVLRGKAVLGAGTKSSDLIFGVNVASEFLDTIKVAGVATLSGGVITENQDVNAGTGKLTASNVLYGAIGGTGITVGPGQTPTITNTGVLSLGGSTGVLTLKAGTGISISGLSISSSVTAPNTFKTIAVTGSSSLTASNSTDTLTFEAGSGIILATNTSSKTLTITGGGAAGWQENNGALSPSNITNDLLLGGISTSTAKFAFINNAGGTPTASISSNLSLAVPTGNAPAATLNLLNNGTLNFQRSPGGPAGLATALFIQNNGNVGIGTTSPQATLDVRGNTLTSWASSLSFISIIGLPTVKNAFTFGNVTGTLDDDLGIKDNAVVIKNVTGNVGIGTTTPLSLLHVSGGNTGGRAALIVDQTGAAANDIFTASSSGTTRFILTNGGNASASAGFTINSAGSLQTTNANTLTIGGNATGELILKQSNLNLLSAPGGAGTGNLFVGLQAGDSNTTGFQNTALGYKALTANTTGSNNTALGFNALLRNTTGNSNFALGVQALDFNSTGNSNIALGVQALFANNGSSNIAVGGQALEGNTTGSNNTAVGPIALNSNTTGSNNTALGLQAGYGAPGAGLYANTSADNNTFIGYNASPFSATQRNNMTAIGAFSVVDQANSLVLGGLGFYAVQVGIGTATPSATLDIQGGNRGGNAALIVNQTGVSTNDLFTASASGTTRLRIANTGELIFADNLSSFFGTLDLTTLTANRTYTFPNVTGTVCISGDTCATSGTVGYWNQSTLGALFPGNSTVDLLVGGTTSSSAKFAVLNINSGTPIASVSANLGNNAAFLTGTGNLQTTNRQTLTLGGGDTGDINLSLAASSNLRISGTAGVSVSGTCVSSTNGIVTGSVTCTGAGSTNWDVINGVITPKLTSTLDFLLGSQSSSSAKFAVLSINSGTPTASVSATATGTGLVLSGGGSIQSLLSANLTLGGSTTGGINFTPGNIQTAFASSIGRIGMGTQTNPKGLLDIAGSAGNNAAFILNQSGSNSLDDIFTASASGVTKFTIQNDGTLVSGKYTGQNAALYATQTTGVIAQATTASSNLCLVSGAAAPSWASCGSGVGTDVFWNQSSGLLFANNSTVDLALGGQASTSAKFAVLNVAGSLTPVASVSATTASGGSGTGLVLSGGGSIQSLLSATLTLGGNTTGGINFTPGNIQTAFLSSIGRVGFGTQTNPKGLLDISGNAGNNATLILNNTGATTSDIFTASASGTTRFVITNSGVVGINTGANNSTLLSTLDIRPNLTNGGTISIASVSGSTSFAGFLVDNTGVGDLFTASNSGATKFTILNNGNLQLAGTTNFLTTLTSAATAARTITFPNATGTICVSGDTCATSGTVGYWNQSTLGTLFPGNSTVDLLVGGTTTASAKFAVLNINSGTPTASISAQNAGASALVLGSDSTIQSVKNQTLTLGGNTTGELILKQSNLNLLSAPGGAGTGNLFAGLQAGNSIIGTNNTAVGYQALRSTSGSTGANNTALGYQALSVINSFATITGSNNTALGYQAIFNSTVSTDTSGSNNTAVGYQAMNSITSGGDNTALGYQALLSETAAARNTAVGSFALRNNVTGDFNTAVGYFALSLNTTAQNTAVGYAALGANTTGSSNTALGYLAGYTNTNQYSNATGSNNTYLGYNAGPWTLNASFNNSTAIGAYALVNASNSLVLGGTAFYAVQVGIGTATPSAALDIQGGQKGGNAALIVNQTGASTNDIFTASSSGTTQFRIANGGNLISVAGANWQPLTNSATALNIANAAGTSFVTFDTTNSRVGIGTTAPNSLLQVAGVASIAGQLTLYTTPTIQTTANKTLTIGGDTTGELILKQSNLNLLSAPGGAGTGNLFVGLQAGNVTTGANNTAVGYQALLNNTTGNTNTAVGFQALNLNTTGLFSTAVGSSALASNTTGNTNTAVGLGALLSNNTGSSNTAVGATALNLNTTGSSNTALGLQALLNNTTGGNNTAVGNGAGGNVTTQGGGVFIGFNAGNAETVGAKLYIATASATALIYGDFKQGQVGINTLLPGGTLDVQGGKWGGNAALIVNQTGAAANDIFTASASGTTKFVVQNNGDTGIGVADALFRLHIQDSQTATASALIENIGVSNTAGHTGLIIKLGALGSATDLNANDAFINFQRGDGRRKGQIIGAAAGVTYETGQADFAEYYRKADPNENMDYGDLICLSQNGGVTKCSSQSSSILGVMSNTAGFVGGGNHSDDPNYIVVGIIGQLKVKVASDSGVLEPATPLTLSTTESGKVIKANKPGLIVGRTIESYNPGTSTDGQVRISLAPTWYDPQVYLGADGNLSYPQSSESAALALGLSGIPQTPTINNQQLTINPSAGSGSSASPSGSFDLARDQNFIDLKNRVANVEAKVAFDATQIEDLRNTIVNSSTQSAFLSSITSQPAVLGASDSAQFMTDIQNATINGDLNVLGRTTVTDLGVTGNITSGLLSIHGLNPELNNGAGGATINSVGDLNLQNNGLGGINILSGKVTIDTQGNIKAAGEIIAKKFNIDTTELSSASLGSGVLKGGESSVIISTTAVTNKSRIFVTATSKTGGQALVLTDKTAGTGFTVEIETPYIKDIRFDWFIIDEK